MTSLVIAVGNCDWEPRLVSALAHPASALQITRRCFYLADALAAAGVARPDFLLISSHLSDLNAETIGLLNEFNVVGLAIDEAEAEKLREIGCRRVEVFDEAAPHAVSKLFATPLAATVHPSAHGVSELPVAPAPVLAREVKAQTKSRVVAVLGTAGAPGRTSLALAVAAELARVGSETLLIDADFAAPSIGGLLALNGDASGLMKAARLVERGALTHETLKQSAHQAFPHLYLLANQPGGGLSNRLVATGLAEVVELARKAFQNVVIDLAPISGVAAFDPFSSSGSTPFDCYLKVVSACSDLLVCGLPSPLSASRLILTLSDLLDFKSEANTLAVINKCPRRRIGAVKAEMQSLLGSHVGATQVVTICEDHRAFSHCEQVAKPLPMAHPRSPAMKGIRELCASLS